MKAPFPWFGGKSKVAPIIWNALGDVSHYVEPFAGSLAVLLGRPPEHIGHVETVNDLDQYIANFWRALAADPDQVAYYADWPVNEADLFSRHLWLVNEGRKQMQIGMAADPEWYDAKIAGWWVWGISAWIGSGWCSGKGPHTYETLGTGVAGQGVKSQIPLLSRTGQGVHKASLHADQSSELEQENKETQGVKKQLPHLAGGNKGVHKSSLSGVYAQRPHLGDTGQGVHRPKLAGGLYDYMHELANRLRRVRVACGDWKRIVTNGALSHGSSVGIFLDPPYSDAAERDPTLYSVDSLSVAHDVREWCIANGDNPRYRIVLAGYEDEHAAHMPDGWRMVAWKAHGGYSSGNKAGNVNRHKERLWFSPHCLGNESAVSGGLFDGGGA